MMRTDPKDQVNHQWLFKEVDSPLLGWEVYARKEQFYQETGITLMAGASKLKEAPKAGQPAAAAVTPLQQSLSAFITNSGVVAKGAEDFTANYGEDADALRDYLLGPTITKARRDAAGWKEGLESTVLALKANEAITKRQRIVVDKAWFEV
jgi:hypothetical protein